MKNLKIWSLALALLVAMTGCEPADDQEGASKQPFNPIATAQLAEKLVGAWEITDYAGQPAEFDVFIEFAADGAYELYQRMFNHDYEKLVGTYELLDAELTGVYTFGTESVDWNNSYTVKIAENPLRLRLVEADGTYAEYKAVESVPAYVKDQAVEVEPTRATEYFL
ncbi:MAG: hypothetical protein J6U93_03320 [Alistipes sp.]|nr:hypothetical protein [Alistipes sp.]